MKRFAQREGCVFLALVVVALATIVQVSRSLSSQSCSFPASIPNFMFPVATLYDIQAVKKCTMTIPFSAKTAASMIESLKKTTECYTFKNIVADSPTQDGFAHLHVDLFAELDRFRATLYPNWWSFNQDVANLYLSLKDPHTVFSKGFAQIIALQPLSISSRYDEAEKKQIIFFSDRIQVFYNTSYFNSFDLQAYIGADIEEIDGEPALEALITASKGIDGSYSKNFVAAFNKLIGFDYQIINLNQRDFPSKPTRAYAIRFPNGTRSEVAFPWGVLAAMNFNTSAIDPSSPPAFPMSKKRASSKLFHDFLEPLDKLPTIAKPNQDVLGTQLFNVSSKVVAMKIPSLMANPLDLLGDLNILCTAMSMGSVVDMGRSQNITNMILDLSGNPGGFVCLAYEFVRRLLNVSFASGVMDIVHSSSSEVLIQNIEKFKIGMPAENTLNASGVSRTRGGKTSLYSALAYKNCPGDAMSSVAPNYSYWKFEKILILSDGLCGSACAQASSYLKQSGAAKAAGLGGVYPEPMAFSTFPGGQVSSLSGMAMLSSMFNISSSALPKALPFSADLTYNALVIEAYSSDKNLRKYPLDFNFLPSDFRVPIWLPFPSINAQMPEVYQSVSYLFNQW